MDAQMVGLAMFAVRSCFLLKVVTKRYRWIREGFFSLELLAMEQGYLPSTRLRVQNKNSNEIV